MDSELELSSGCGTVDHGPPSHLPFGQHTPDPGLLAIETALPGLVAEDLALLARVVSVSQRAAALRA
jgi:hypothetical protein